MPLLIRWMLYLAEKLVEKYPIAHYHVIQALNHLGEEPVKKPVKKEWRFAFSARRRKLS